MSLPGCTHNGNLRPLLVCQDITFPLLLTHDAVCNQNNLHDIYSVFEGQSVNVYH